MNVHEFQRRAEECRRLAAAVSDSRAKASWLRSAPYDIGREAAVGRCGTRRISGNKSLLAKCPARKEGDKFAPIEISAAMRTHFQLSQGAATWRRFEFRRLNMIERARFIELCVAYEWEEDAAGSTGQMIPPSQWDVDDKAEMTALLDLAGRTDQGRPSSR